MSTSRRYPSSRSMQGSHLGASASRPFLTMLTPLGRNYQGYTQANQSLMEEDEFHSSDEDIESGNRPGSSPRHTERNSQQQGDQRIHHHPSSDDEAPPPSFMVETVSRKKGKGKAKAIPTSGRKTTDAQPLLPTTKQSVFNPPRPSEIEDETPINFQEPSPSRPLLAGLGPYEQALWKWVNVSNLDAFLQDVYDYYQGKGIYSISLSRGLNLLTVGFVIGFSTFLLGCIDYSRIKPEKSTRLSDVIVDQCISKFSGFTLIFFLLFTAFYVWEIVEFIFHVQRLVDMYHFYTYLLKIPDEDIQTISWGEVVRRIGAIREENPHTAISSKHAQRANDTTAARLDAHDVANRILRQENYLIALFNKELLDLRVPLPRTMKRYFFQHTQGSTLTKILEWNLRFCLMWHVFDRQGAVRKKFLSSKYRQENIAGLRHRFIFMGILNAIFAPFIVLYVVMYSFFRYFEQYHKDPSTIGGRRYTSYAQWKFREFNELPHFFTRRLHESYPAATMYIGQFPNEKLTIVTRFVAFIAGSFAAVLVLASMLDPDLVVHFEITPHRTVFFYITVFGSILAVARGMIPEEGRVFDPEILMTEVIAFTHYMPDSWKDQLHSKQVHAEFGQLFAMKIMIFAQELLSVVVTPFILWFSLPDCAPAVIDFFRDFTVHVDGRGYVCSFAEFDFQRHGNVKFGAPSKVHNQKMLSKEGKMEKSFLHFKATNPEWNPTDPSGSLFLSRMADFQQARRNGRSHPNEGQERQAETAFHDRAQEYDRALLQSQHAAARRRLGASTLGMSALNPPPGPSASSIFGGFSTAKTAVLGDSQGSTMPIMDFPRSADSVHEPEHSTIRDEDLDPDAENSGLGGSYIDGARKPRPEELPDDEEEGGVIGLLAQIYSRRDGRMI